MGTCFGAYELNYECTWRKSWDPFRIKK